MTTVLGTHLGRWLGTQLGASGGQANYYPDLTKMYAISNFSLANYFITQAAGGESGTAAGFGYLVLCRPSLTSPASFKAIIDNYGTGPIQGYTLGTNSSNQVISGFTNGSNTVINPPTTALNLSDHLRLFSIIGFHTGSGNQANTSVFRGIYPAPSTCVGVTPSTYALGMGVRATAGPGNAGTGHEILGILCFRGTPTEAQLNALADTVRTLGDVPASMAGATITHRWSVRDVLAGMGSPVTDSQTAPASLPDSVTAAAVDTMARQGSPIVRVIDPSVDGRKSYGALGFGASGHLKTSGGSIITGSTLDITTELTIYDRGATQTVWTDVNYPTANAGIGLFISPSNTLSVYSYGAGATVATAAINTSDLGIKYTWRVTYIGGVWRLYKDGVQQGTDTAGAFTPSASPLFVGIHPNLGSEFRGGNALYRVLIAGKHDWDLTQDITANGGPDNGIPAQVLDRIGSDHLTNVGGALQVASRSERLWSYETTPILRGATGFTAANYFNSGAGAAGLAAGFGGTFVWIPKSTSTSKTRMLWTTLFGSPNRGVEVRTLGTNATVSVQFADASNTLRTSGSGVLASVLNKICVFSFVWDGPSNMLRVYLNRAEIGTGTSITGYAAPPGASLIGREITGPDSSASDSDFFGYQLWHGVATRAQIQSQHDAILANDGRIQPCPGMTSALMVDLTQDINANGGAIPAAIEDRVGTNHYTRNGSPTVADMFARALGW